MFHSDFTVTLGKSDSRWGTPAGCAHEVEATFPRCFRFDSLGAFLAFVLAGFGFRMLSVLYSHFMVTLGKSDPRWGTPAGRAYESKAMFSAMFPRCFRFDLP